MQPYKMQVKLIGPSGETIDDWTDEIPREALFIQPGKDTETPGKCYFRAHLLTALSGKITQEILQFMRTRGWYPLPPVDVPLPLDVPANEDERLVRAI
jgi:hypothetical protein